MTLDESATPLGGVIIVTGTSTGVGKTVVTAACAAVAHAAGRSVAVVKPAQTGTQDGDSDVAEAARLAGLPTTAVHELTAFPEPLAPATAARRAGLPGPDLVTTRDRVLALREQHDLVLVEGAGGVLVHFDDRSAWTIADLAAALEAPALMVAAAGLGTLNHTALTLEALRARRVEPLGLVIGAWPAAPDLADRCNLADQTRSAAVPILGALPEGLGRSGPAGPERDFLAAARAGLAPSLGGTFDAADFTRNHAPEPFRA
jgi:dethiobiotin synthetase